MLGRGSDDFTGGADPKEAGRVGTILGMYIKKIGPQLTYLKWRPLLLRAQVTC